MATKVYEVVITPSAAGFGEWDTESDSCDAWDDLGDMMSDIHANVGPITVLTGHQFIGQYSTPDEDIPNITGAIHNCPPIVYAFRDREGELHYAGIGMYHVD
jgi:hypothetical protein